MTGTRIGRGSGSGSRVARPGCGSCLDGSHEKVTLSSGERRQAAGGAHDHRCRWTSSTGVGLLIDGDVVPGGAGTYPVTNPARPAEVVFEAPAHLAGAARPGGGRRPPRRSGPGPRWTVRGPGRPGHRGRRGGRGRRRGAATWPACSPASTARRYLEADLRHRDHGRHGRRLRAAGGRGAGAPRRSSGGATRIEWVPHGVVAAILPFNWPVSVMANKVLPALLAGDTVVVKAPPTCPGHGAAGGGGHGRGAAARRAQRRERARRRARCGAGRPSRRRHGLLHRRRGHRAGRHGRRGRHDPPGRARARGQRRRHPRPRRGRSTPPWPIGSSRRPSSRSGQVCMAIKRLYVHRDRLDETVDALAEPAGRPRWSATGWPTA